MRSPSQIIGTATGPWSALHRLTLGAVYVVAGAMTAIGWVMVSGVATVGAQYRGVALGSAGVALAAAGNVLWLTLGRRAIAGRLAPLNPPTEASACGPGGAGVLMAAQTMGRYHRPGCQLLRGKAAVAAGLSTHIEEGREPCGVCQP